jgi:MFS family permease
MIENPLTLLRRLPPVVQLLVAGTFVNKLGSFIIPYLTLVLRREFDQTPSQVGALLAAYGAGSLISILIGGALTDRLGRRATLLISLLGSGVIAVLLGFAPGIRVFAVLLVLFGFVADLYRPASSSIIGDLLPSAQRATGFAALRMAVNLGFAVGMSLGGLLADWSWRILFFGDGVTTLLFGLVVYLHIPETRQAPAPARSTGPESAGEPAEAAFVPWRDRVFVEMMVVSFLFGLIFFSHITVLPLTMTVSAGYPAWVFGVLVGVNGLAIAAFEMPIVDRLRGHRRLRTAALGTFLAGLGFGIMGVLQHWSWFLFGVLLFTAGEILASPGKMAFITDWAPPLARGRYLSWYQGTWSLAIGLNPLLFLPLHARLGDQLFWPLMVILALPAVFLLIRLDETADRRERLRGLSEGPVPLPVVLSPETGSA